MQAALLTKEIYRRAHERSGLRRDQEWIFGDQRRPVGEHRLPAKYTYNEPPVDNVNVELGISTEKKNQISYQRK